MLNLNISKAVDHLDWRSDYMTLQQQYKQKYAEGLAEGKADADRKYSQLIILLSEAGRADDITKAAKDETYRKKLYAELNIETE